MKIFLILPILFFFVSCSNQDLIKVKEDRTSLVPEPDKQERIDFETARLIFLLCNEKISSFSIASSPHGKKLIQSGVEILPYLKPLFFKDTSTTTIYSEPNKRFLNKGEVAILVSNEIQHIPVAFVAGIQQCTEYYDVEHFLDQVKEDPDSFIERYEKWLVISKYR